MQSIRCGQCRKALRIRPEFAGRKVRCTHCGTILSVPHFATSPEPPQSIHDLSGLEDGPAGPTHGVQDAYNVPPERLASEPLPQRRSAARPVVRRIRQREQPVGITLYGWLCFLSGILGLLSYLAGIAWVVWQGWGKIPAPLMGTAGISFLAITVPLHVVFGIILPKLYLEGRVGALRAYQGFMGLTVLVWTFALVVWIGIGGHIALFILLFPFYALQLGLFAYHFAPHVESYFSAQTVEFENYYRSPYFLIPAGTVAAGLVFGLCFVPALRSTMAAVAQAKGQQARRAGEFNRRFAPGDNRAAAPVPVNEPKPPPPRAQPTPPRAPRVEISPEAVEESQELGDATQDSQKADPVDRALADLRSEFGTKPTEAAERLARLPVDESRRDEVVSALELRLTDTNVFTRTAAAKALAHWGGEKSVDALAVLLDDRIPNVRETAMLLLAQFEDERIPAAIAARLGDFFTRRSAQQALARMGPRAEEAVLPYLDHSDRQVRQAACEVLGAIGTKASIARLRRLARQPRGANAFVAQAAAQAIRSIEARAAAERKEKP